MTGVRVLAALIMTAACGGVGYSAARTQTRRRRALAELGQAVDRLEINMLEQRLPLAEALKRAGHPLFERAAKGLDELPPDEIVAALQELTGRVEASFILDRLDYMKMGGRCSAVTLLGANLLKLRPCIEVKDGKMGVGKKYRGSFEKCLVQYITDKIGARSDLELRRVFITHSGLPEEMVQKAVETVQKLQPFDEICVTRAGCTVSSHCGPGTIGVLYIRKAEA